MTNKKEEKKQEEQRRQRERREEKEERQRTIIEEPTNISNPIIVPNPTKLHPKRTRPATYEYEYEEPVEDAPEEIVFDEADKYDD